MPHRQMFLGRIIDGTTGKPGPKPLMYDPADFTTHGIITGMTGSGKTGLGVAILEEAALQGIPAIIIDPKGDMPNLLLHFPDLAPADFEPWVDPETARRARQSPAELAAETAANWRDGLASWGLGREQLLALQAAAEFAVYTPGSSAGIPVNILASFAAPDIDWSSGREILREKISTIVTALLSLIGMGEVDPLRSREHILLSNIVEHHWSSGRALTLADLITETQSPPFDRLGAFPLESFYPSKDRFNLAMLLNNFLASPSFQSWLEGQALDIGNMLYTSDGRPRHNIFYLAHLSEAERQFVVSLIFAAVESWMRGQRGTSNLRLLVYFDEIMGYMPPVANPPTRQVMLRMFKQARAYGVGMILATQNPVDVDYKGLSNAGTWLIGRLQTERDKARLMDGLKGAAGNVNLAALDKMIAGLGRRMFLLHSVHRREPVVFGTRWVLNYLAGPVTRTQIPALARLPNAAQAPGAQGSTAPAATTTPADLAAGSAPAAYVRTPAAPRPDVATPPAPSVGLPAPPPSLAGVEQLYMPVGVEWADALRATGLAAAGVASRGLLYRPALYAQAELRYLQRRYNLDYSRRTAALVHDNEGNRVEWEVFVREPLSSTELGGQAVARAQFEIAPPWMSDARRIKALEKDFVDWLVQSGVIRILANETLKLYASPDTLEQDFLAETRAAAEGAAQAQADKAESSLRRRVDTLRNREEKLAMDLRQRQSELGARRIEEVGAGIETVLGMLGSGRRRSLAPSLSRRRMTSRTGSQVQQTQASLEAIQRELAEAEQELGTAVAAARERWAQVALDNTTIPVAPTRTNIFTERFAVVWVPYHLLEVAGQPLTLRAAP